tara:strand:- start:563 stop:685 length:123 start_codon:yes stop_codon:yes gene_type:complete
MKPKQKNPKLKLATIIKNVLAKYEFIIKDLIIIFNLSFQI